VIPNFLDLPPEPLTAPAGTGILFVGPADRHKGLHVLLRAWPHVRPADARLTVVGADRGEPDVAQGGRAVDFAGWLGPDGVRERLRAAALVVAPAIWPEPCPTAVLEALAAGRPVVASDIGGHPDLVVRGRTGLLVRPGDPGALAAALSGLLTDAPRLQAMARAAHDSAEQFGTAAVVGRIQAVYAEALAGQGLR
jgi:glycosyltransferase involved in cell wall biosynthesis